MKRLLMMTCAALAAAVLLTPGPALAATHKPQNQDKPKQNKVPPAAKVSAVDVANKTVAITDADGTTKTYHVDSLTVITVNGQSAKLADLKAGMKVDLTVDASGTRLSRLDATRPPEDKSAKKKHAQ